MKLFTSKEKEKEEKIKINNQLNSLQNQINSIKNKDINLIYININKKEDDLKNILNVKDIIIKELERKILKEINKKYAELKSMFYNISFNIFIKKDMQKPIDDIYGKIQNLMKYSIQGAEFKFTYDINNLFVNLNKEDIIQVIYNKYIENQNLNKTLLIRDLEDIVLEKISLVLPQDIILLMQYTEFKQQYNNIKEKIINFYKKGEHINLINFIKTMTYHKNIIYTFTKIDEPLLLNTNIKTQIFGILKKNNIKEIIINSMISEDEFKKELDNFYSNKDYMIIIIKIDPKFIDLKKYIDLINIIIENNEQEKKGFIITVHINRIYEEEIKSVGESESINYSNYNYNDYYQILIDDLNEKEDIIIEEKIKIKENISIEELILKLFVDQVNNITDDNNIFKLVNILLKCKKINTKFYPFFSTIIKKIINNNPKHISDNLDTIKNSNKLYINLINIYNNEVLGEIILNIFENHFNLYFESIANLSKEEIGKYFPKYFEEYKNNNTINPTYILLDQNIELFTKCINFLEDIYIKTLKKDKNQNKNELLCKLYCISYIKIYLYKSISLNFFNKEHFGNFDKIIKIIEGNENNNFRNMLKIYVFKIYFYLLNNNYHEFSNYNYLKHKITFYEEFKPKLIDTKKSMLTYYLVPSEGQFLENERILDKFLSTRFNGFNSSTPYFKDYIEKNGIDIFYTISTNLIVSNICLIDYKIWI